MNTSQQEEYSFMEKSKPIRLAEAVNYLGGRTFRVRWDSEDNFFVSKVRFGSVEYLEENIEDLHQYAVGIAQAEIDFLNLSQGIQLNDSSPAFDIKLSMTSEFDEALCFIIESKKLMHRYEFLFKEAESQCIMRVYDVESSRFLIVKEAIIT